MRSRVAPEQQIDFAWLYYMAMNRLGFTYIESGMLAMGEWQDFLECFKGQYNFETKQNLYDIKNNDTVDKLDDI